MTLTELTVAAVVRPGHTSLSDMQDEMETDMKSVIRGLFGPMFRISDDDTVGLVHQSAKDFFLNMRSDTYGDPLISAFYLPCAESHLHITMACLTYLSFDEFGRKPKETPRGFRRLDDSAYQLHQLFPFEPRQEQLRFLDYATFHWPAHARTTYSEKPNQQMSVDIERLEEVFQRLTESRTNFYLAYKYSCFSERKFAHDNVPPLYIVASFGLPEFTQKLIRCGRKVNEQNDEYGSALIVAVKGNHEKVVRVLIDHGVDINAKGGNHGTALQVAASWGKMEIVELLIDHGVDINAKGGKHGTALQAAACEGKMKIVQLLIDRGANINAKGGIYGSALQAAASAYNDKVEIVQLLIDRGADVNAKGGEYGTALQAAIFEGNNEIAQILIAYGAEQRNGTRATARAHVRRVFNQAWSMSHKLGKLWS